MSLSKLAAMTIAQLVSSQAVTLREIERECIYLAIADCNGNLRAAARRLGISRSTIYRYLEQDKMRRACTIEPIELPIPKKLEP